MRAKPQAGPEGSKRADRTYSWPRSGQLAWTGTLVLYSTVGCSVPWHYRPFPCCFFVLCLELTEGFFALCIWWELRERNVQICYRGACIAIDHIL